MPTWVPLISLGCTFHSREAMLINWDACKHHEFNISRAWQMHWICSWLLTCGIWMLDSPFSVTDPAGLLVAPWWVEEKQKQRGGDQVTSINGPHRHRCTVFEVLQGKRRIQMDPTTTVWPKVQPETKLPDQHTCMMSGAYFHVPHVGLADP